MTRRKRVTRALALLALTLAGCRASMEGPGGGAARPEAAQEREAEAAAPVLLGVIVPSSGPEMLQRYGSLVLEGVRVAVDEHARAGGRPVELVVLDDAGDPERAGGLVAELQRRGAVGVVGPLLPNALRSAAQARTDSSLVIVGPTAGEAPVKLPNVYALNASDAEGARALARHAAAAGLRRVGLLYRSSPEYERQAAAFKEALVEAGGRIVADVPFDSGTTTFATQLRTLRSAQPQAVFIPAAERDIRQLSPQINFYGLGAAGVTILGNESWTGDAMLRRLAGLGLRIVATTPLLRTSAETGWQEFVARYESRYRRTLGTPIPALGHDAARLILQGLEGRSADAGPVGRRIASIRDLRGATGVLSIRDGALVRRPFLVRIEEGRLVPVARPDTPKP